MNDFYTIGESASDQLMNNIDTEETRILLYKYYKVDNIAELEKSIRNTIKDEEKFDIILKDLKLTKKDFYIITNMIVPKLYNKRFVNFIRTKYKKDTYVQRKSKTGNRR
jgi:hypothetical protein